MHAGMVIESLNNGKNVFVEKPLALTKSELKKLLVHTTKQFKLDCWFQQEICTSFYKTQEFIE